MTAVKIKNLSISFGVIILIVIAAFIGKNRSDEAVMMKLSYYFPESLYKIVPAGDNKFILTDKYNKESFVYIGEGKGYNGNVRIVVHVDSDSTIQECLPLEHNETPSYFNKLDKHHFFKKITGNKINFLLNTNEIDVVSGATSSSRAVINAAKHAYLKGEQIIMTEHNFPKFGFLETIVSILLIIGIFITKVNLKNLKKVLLWLSLGLSVIILGFYYNQHITLSRITSLISGYFPSIIDEFYIYLLIFGSILIVLLTKKNIYCHSVCPFGSAQELLAKTGKAKTFRPSYYKFLKYVQHLLTLSVLLVALALDDPAITNYEVFGAFFQLTANTVIFTLLIIVVILSLFIKRPWCNFLCPIDSVFTYIKYTEKSISDLWKKK